MGEPRYFLVKVPEGEWASIRFNEAGAQIKAENHGTTEVVEIVPEKRDSNWMERALAAGLATARDAREDGE